jgi:hypothetical protein
LLQRRGPGDEAECCRLAVRLAVVITVLVLGGMAVGGWMLLNGGDIRGPLPTSMGSLPSTPLL